MTLWWLTHKFQWRWCHPALCWTGLTPWWRCNLGPRCSWQVSQRASACSYRAFWRQHGISETWGCKSPGWWHCWDKCKFCKRAGTNFLGKGWREMSWPPRESGRASTKGQTEWPPLPTSWWPAERQREMQCKHQPPTEANQGNPTTIFPIHVYVFQDVV